MITLPRALVLASLLLAAACATPNGRFDSPIQSSNSLGGFTVSIELYEADMKTPVKDDPFADVLRSAISDELSRQGLLAQPGVSSGRLRVEACYWDGGNVLFRFGAMCLQAPGSGYTPSTLRAQAVLISPEGKVLATSHEFFDTTPLQTGMGKVLAERYAQALVKNIEQGSLGQSSVATTPH
jgi:hypothetical protein